MGTRGYLSPEAAAGDWDRVGPASDVYGLGATLYALLTGRAPLQGSNTDEVLEKARRGEFVPPRQLRRAVSRALEAICLKAMAFAPEARYATALELAAEVEHWLADEPVRAYPDPWTTRARRWVKRHRLPVTAVAAAVLAAAVLGGGAWLRQVQAEEVARVQRVRADARAHLDAGHRYVAKEEVDGARAQLTAARGPLLREPSLGAVLQAEVARLEGAIDRVVKKKEAELKAQQESRGA